MKTSKDYTVDWREYGKITVPAGTPLTHQTAMGIDKDYHFVNSTDWITKNYPTIDRPLIHDVNYYGINVPKEFVDYSEDIGSGI